MRRDWIRAVAATLLIACASQSWSAEPGTRGHHHLAAQVDQEISARVPKLLEVYRHLHANPELSHYEEKTSALVADYLRGLDFHVLSGLGRYNNQKWTGHGVVGVLRNGPGPTVLVRAELDALPIEERTQLPYASRVRALDEQGRDTGVMHACGHDLHLTSLLGTAAIMMKMRQHWSGSLVLVGEPSEESLDGVHALHADRLYERVPSPDYILAAHSIGELEAGRIGLVSGFAQTSSDNLNIAVRGVGGHGSRPQDAKDPVVLAAQIVLALQTIVSRENAPLQPAVVTVGSIHGGAKANTIPDEVVIEVSVRALDQRVKDRHVLAIHRVVAGLAVAAGIPEDRLPLVQLREGESVVSTYNDPELTDRVASVLSLRMGSNNVLRMGPRMSGDTFGGYGELPGRRIPSLQMFLGVADPQAVFAARESGQILPGTHSPQFAPQADPALRTSLTAMTAVLLDLMERSD